MGYHLNRLDEPVFIAVSKPLLTEFGIHYRLESWTHPIIDSHKTTAFARGILTCQLVTQINLKYTTTFSLHVNAELMSNSMMLIKQAFHPFQSNPKYFYGPCPLVFSDRGI